MRRMIFVLLLLLSSVSYGQYWGERVAEKSFEQSELFFKSYFLNPYGLHEFGDAALGLIDNPFLKLHLNPANLPDLGDRDIQIYIDFRGDRTEPEVIENYYGIPYDYFWIYPTPVWYSKPREEPQPIFSVGLLTYPLEGRDKDFYFGVTYEMVYQQEKYYTVPSWIYYYRFGYDAFGERMVDAPIIPVEDRYFGKDELLTEAHQFSLYTGLSLSRQLDAGLSLSGVFHSRDGGYINARNDEYFSAYSYDYLHYQAEERQSDYEHLDISAGLRYHFSPQTTGAVKFGYLTGEVDQDYSKTDSAAYQYSVINDPNQWSTSHSRSVNQQSWNREGDSYYGRLSLDRNIGPGRTVAAYYRYGHTDIELSNVSLVRDTSMYASQWHYDTITSNYEGFSYTRDDRSGYGESRMRDHDFMVSLRWRLQPKKSVLAGLFFSRQKSVVESDEPITVTRYSEQQREINGLPDYQYISGQYEEKVLNWHHESLYWTIQIPVLLDMDLADFLGMKLGVNRILEKWRTSDITTAYFIVRELNNNGTITTQTYFGERYTQPDEKKTDDHTVVMASFEAKVSPQFTVRLLLNPEFEKDFRVAEWWLSFDFMP